MGFLAGPLTAPSSTSHAISNESERLPEGVIESLDGEGRGVARVEGKAIFIEGALPGERVTFRSYLVKPNYELARVEQVFRESSARVNPACEFFGNCGGCAMQHVEFRTQVAVKQRVLEDAFERIGKVEPESLLRPIYGTPWGYRHRARVSVRYVRKKGVALVGFREKHSTYVADMTNCQVLTPHVASLLVPLRRLVEELSILERMPQIEVAVGDNVTVLVLRLLEPLSPADEAALDLSEKVVMVPPRIKHYVGSGSAAASSTLVPIPKPLLTIKKITGSFQSAAIFNDSCQAPILVVASPIWQITTPLRFWYLSAYAAPVASGNCPPTMA